MTRAGLIAKLKAVKQGSRRLDRAIDDFVKGYPTTNPDYRAPPYTTSIDVALALVPEGVGCVKVSLSRNKVGRQYCHATLEQDADSLGRDMLDHEECKIEAQNASTPALALCIAALKAR